MDLFIDKILLVAL